MLYRNLFLSAVLIAVLFACKAKGGSTNQEVAEPKLSAEEIEELQFQAQLAAKADTALLFCQSKGLNTDFCLLADMGRHSGKFRMVLWDFTKDSIAHTSLCCHGYGKNSKVNKPVFSNEPGSYCTSLGKYKVGARSYSNWGIHVHYKLHGLDSTNSNAFKRWVVLHSYEEVPETEIYPSHIPLGYSQGCPVISDKLMTVLDGLLKKPKKPVLLWVYSANT